MSLDGRLAVGPLHPINYANSYKLPQIIVHLGDDGVKKLPLVVLAAKPILAAALTSNVICMVSVSKRIKSLKYCSDRFISQASKSNECVGGSLQGERANLQGSLSAGCRLYRSRILQPSIRWKALAEIYSI